MKIGIISDSHDHHANALKAVDVFNQHSVEHVFHAGDIISPFTARAFASVRDAVFTAVFGNNDGEKLFLKETIQGFGGQIHDESFKGKVGGKKIFMIHRPGVVPEVVKSREFDIVIYGHTHKQDIRWEDKTLVINPGESTDWLTGSPAVVIVDTERMDPEIIGL
jgi:uncharacterized protein